MAGSDQKKDARRRGERVIPSLDRGSSRVSKAATGGQGSVSVQRVEQRSNTPSPRPRGNIRGASAVSGAVKPSSPRSRQPGAGASSGVGSSRNKGAVAQSPRRPSASKQSSKHNVPTNEPRDTQFIQLLLDKWNALEPYQRQRIVGGLLLVLSILLFASLTILSSAPGWAEINKFFLTFFGWSAYILAIGCIAFSAARFLEGLRQERLIRRSMVTGLIILWLLVLIESRLIMGPLQAGALAEFLVIPINGWPGAVQHVTVIGLILVAIIFTFRITFGHVLMVWALFQKAFSDSTPDLDFADDDDPSKYLGQRPQFSRYGANRSMAADLDADDEPVQPSRGRSSRAGRGASMARSVRRPIQEEEDEPLILDDDVEYNQQAYQDDNLHDDETIVFLDDLDEDDPRNDINIHKHQVGIVPRGSVQPRAIDLNDHAKATRNAQQHHLDFEEEDELPPNKVMLRSAAAPADLPTEMEPVAIKLEPQRVPGIRPLGKPQENEPPMGSLTGRSRPPLIPKPPVQEKPSRAPVNAAVHNEPNIRSSWKLPSLDLLNNPDIAKLQVYGEDTTSLANIIQDTLRSFRVDAEVREEDISIGPTVIRFGIRPTGKPQMVMNERTGRLEPVLDANGQMVYESRTRVSRIMALQNDLALVLEAKTIRMEAPVPGRPYVGVEIPNKNSRLVTLREVLESKEYQALKGKSKLAIGLGKDVAGTVRVADLAKMPHALIAGATGAGKSVCINTIIASILSQATPDDVRLLMVDPKMVELNMYNGIPHLLSPVVIEVDKVVSLLKNAINEMERRYRLFSQLNVRNLDGYRKMRLEKIKQGDTSLNNLPAIVIIIDELADLMMAAPEEVESMICRLAQLARATGIHLVVATQRPSVDVITGLIKANIPTRISFMVSSAVDSRTIIDMGGAERLLGRGDMLYLPADAGRPERIQGAFLADDEAQKLADYWRQQVAQRAQSLGQQLAPAQIEQRVEPGWELKAEAEDEFELEDELLGKAEEVVREHGRASISLLQRRLKIGYSRAARLIDLLEHHGIIGQQEGSGRAREVYGANGHQGDQRGSGTDYADDEGQSMMDEAEEILQEERARNEFVRNQAARFQMQQGRRPSPRAYDEDDEE